jgi:hypothetical protein
VGLVSGTRIRKRGQTYLAWGPDMSSQSLWNPAREAYMSGMTRVFGDMVDL